METEKSDLTHLTVMKLESGFVVSTSIPGQLERMRYAFSAEETQKLLNKIEFLLTE